MKRVTVHWREGVGAACGALASRVAQGFAPVNVTTYPAEMTCRRPRCVRLAHAAAVTAKKRKA